MNWDERFLMAKRLLSKGCFNAAKDILRDLEHHPTQLGAAAEMYYLFGTICLYKDAHYKEAIHYFSLAVENAYDKDEEVRYTNFLAIAYLKMAEFDTCYRYLVGLVDNLEDVSRKTRAMVYANLSAIQGISGFYERAIASIDQSIEALSDSDNPSNHVIWNNNKGLAYLEIGEYEKSEYHLKRALELGGNQYLEPLSELGRLCLLQGNMHESIKYAGYALNLVWSSIISYNKDEVARLCYLLSNIAIRIGHHQLAIRFAEKAQVYFGQLGMWRQWQQLEFQLEQWSETPPMQFTDDNVPILFMNAKHFLQCLEALNAQELIDKRISNLLDLRTYYVQLFARELRLSDEEEKDLILASRFADYGLTALENEVALNPTRSPVAFEQYKQHPSLSVRMITMLGLSERIIKIVEDHHEHYDGSGYPRGKAGHDVDQLSRVLRVIDAYSTGIALEHKDHSEIFNEIVRGSGTLFDPRICQAFEAMFDVK